MTVFQATIDIPALPAQGSSMIVSSAAMESFHVRPVPCSLASLTVSIGTKSGWALLFDALVAPPDGPCTPVWWAPIDSNGTIGYLNNQWVPALPFKIGFVAVFSLTGPFIKTASSTAAFSGQII